MIAVGEVVQIFMDLLTVFFINTVETNAVETFLAGGRTYQLFFILSAFRIYRFDTFIFRFTIAFAIPVICLLCKLLRIFRSNIKVLLQCFSRQNTTHPRVCGL